MKPNARLDTGQRVQIVGEPFRVHVNPPGHTWLAAIFPDGKLRPVVAERVEHDG